MTGSSKATRRKLDREADARRRAAGLMPLLRWVTKEEKEFLIKALTHYRNTYGFDDSWKKQVSIDGRPLYPPRYRRPPENGHDARRQDQEEGQRPSR